VRLTPVSADEADLPLGVSRLGGRPDLADDVEWPLGYEDWPLAFLAQLDLAELRPYDVDGVLPVQGLCRSSTSTKNRRSRASPTGAGRMGGALHAAGRATASA
jgi:Domain of unknown function (DUF1963)